MRLIEIMKGFFNDDAERVRKSENDERRSVCGAVHPFASRRERAISDLCRVRMLAQALALEPGGTSDCRAFNSVRDLIPRLGELVSKRTGESSVYWNAEQNAYFKVKDPSAKAPLKCTSESDWPYEHVIHNILFPTTPYELISFAREQGHLRIVLRQTCVSSEAFPTDAEVAGYLENQLGLVPEDRYWFGNEWLSVTDVGAQGDNVLKGATGELFFIDPLIRLKKPAIDVISGLVGDLGEFRP